MSPVGFALFPPAASNLAGWVDRIYIGLLILCGSVALGILAVALLFCIRYRKGSAVDRQVRTKGTLMMEATWTGITLLIFLGLFLWTSNAYFAMSRPPAGATEIYVIGKQWMWKIQHPDGRREINELHLLVNRPVKLIMTSQDVIHDFFVPEFRSKQDVLPGRYTTEWFTPTKVGIYHIFCAQYCGTDHARMGGKVYVQTPAEFARWQTGLAGQPRATGEAGSTGGEATGKAEQEGAGQGSSLVATGERLFFSRGCSGCHTPNSTLRAPMLNGIYGKEVPLSDGTLVRADEQYLRDSILLPNKQIAAGYQPIMPTFQGHISDEEVNALIAYIKSMGTANAGGAGRGGS